MSMHRPRMHAISTGTPSRGVVLLALLLILALLGIGLMSAVDVWSLTKRRERERELLFAGDQYRQAIRRYYLAGARALPPSLEVLLDDDRSPIPMHHLRRAYPDPMTGSADWGLVKVGDRIIGVYSRGEGHPLKETGFAQADRTFEGATTYQDWVFVFELPRRGFGPAAPVPTSPGASQPPTSTAPVTPKRSPS